MDPAEGNLVIEVVVALPREQVLLSITLPPGSTIGDALECSEICRRFPRMDFTACQVGIFGSARARDTVLADGDRVEIYRPLIVDPKEARRARGRVRQGRKDAA